MCVWRALPKGDKIHLRTTALAGAMDSISYALWESLGGKSRDMPSGRKREPAPWSCTSGGVTKRPRQEDEPTKISASMMCIRHKQRRKRLSTRHSRSADPHAVQSTQQHCTMNRRCGRTECPGTHLHHRLLHTHLQKLRCALSPSAASPSRQIVASSSAVCHDCTTKAIGSRRQIAAASGVRSLHPSRPVGSDYGRKRRMLGSSGGTAGLG